MVGEVHAFCTAKAGTPTRVWKWKPLGAPTTTTSTAQPGVYSHRRSLHARTKSTRVHAALDLDPTRLQPAVSENGRRSPVRSTRRHGMEEEEDHHHGNGTHATGTPCKRVKAPISSMHAWARVCASLRARGLPSVRPNRRRHMGKKNIMMNRPYRVRGVH